MSKTEIIPAIDIIDGKCVRLQQGNYSNKTIYNENPLEVAKSFEDLGIKRLHLVDLEGAKSGKIINYKVLETLATKTNLVIDFGGGVKSNDDLRIAFNCGAAMVTGGSIAVKDRATFTDWIKAWGAEKIILGADIKDRKIAITGWLEDTAIEIFPFLESYLAEGIRKVICTDISKDGMLQGPAIDLYKEILEKLPETELIASGGVTTIADVEKLIEMNISGIIIGKAIYEGKINLKEVMRKFENDTI